MECSRCPFADKSTCHELGCDIASQMTRESEPCGVVLTCAEVRFLRGLLVNVADRVERGEIAPIAEATSVADKLMKLGVGE